MQLFLTILLFCQSSLLAAGEKAAFPVKAESSVPERRVDLNLLKLYEKEKEDPGLTIEERNAAELRAVSALKSCSSGNDVSGPLAESVLQALESNPVAGKKGASKYDPDFEIGFCFGRAAFVHLELLNRGIAPCRIAKVFAVGTLQWEHARWEYHVATMVQDSRSTWWVIDSHYDHPMALGSWMKKVSQLATKKSEPLRFYVTDASKFLALPGPYEDKPVYKEWYGTYFPDLLATFEKNKPAKD